jgi:hypothetical protein
MHNRIAPAAGLSAGALQSQVGAPSLGQQLAGIICILALAALYIVAPRARRR